MRPAPSNTTSDFNPSPRFWSYNSPLPYLFGGLALMLLLVTAALIILAYSYRKRRPSADHEKVAPPISAAAADDSPKFVVIMAGENNPTHIAVPFPPSDFVAQT